jgi:L-tyrosine isonitrile synthase
MVIMSGVPISLPAESSTRVVALSSGTLAANSAKVLSSFNTWAFKREQPSSIVQIASRITDAIRTHAPIAFVLYWGKGPRSRAAAPDVACLDFLASLGRRVEALHAPGVEFGLIFTDTHAELNGHARDAIESYFSDIGAIAAGHGFKGFRLGDIVRAAGPVSIDLSQIDEDHVDLLTLSADKWFRGGGSAREGARRYLIANMIERRAVGSAFPEAIFATFNGSEFDFLFPATLPRFYMYSLRKGCSVKPWFMDEDGRFLSSAG